MNTLTITAGGITETIRTAHADLIVYALVNGHDEFGDKVTFHSDNPEGAEWRIEALSGLIVVVVSRQ